MSARVAFFGLGTMGAPMATHLVKAGYEVLGIDPAAGRARRWAAESGGVAADDPRAAADAVVVVTCVSDEPALEELAFAGGLAAALAPGACWIDHTTTSATLALRLAEAAAARGVLFVDAPISGGADGAAAGALAAMVGGADAAYRVTEPVIACYADTRRHVGPAGSGQVAKMMNQLCIAGTVRGLHEAIALGRAASVDLDAVFAVLRGGSANSVQMERRAAALDRVSLSFTADYGWIAKDLEIALAEAQARGAELPVAAAILALLRR
jgi:3-hydroxyisobutyrate dehydrogenase